MARRCKCRFCKKELTTDIAYREKEGNKNIYFCNELEYIDYEEERKEKQRQREKDLQDGKKVLEYIKNLVGYDDNQELPKMTTIRLVGLKNSYSNEIILETLQQEKDSIVWAIQNKNFEKDAFMFSYIIAIVSNNINDVYKKHKRKIEVKARENSKEIEMELYRRQQQKVKQKETNDGIMSLLEEDDI